MHAIAPKEDCPHIHTVHPSQTIQAFQPCEECQDTTENWHCLSCYAVLCSRYVHGHMKHHVKEGHCICLSESDLSVWCYECDTYIKHENLEPLKLALYDTKFKK